MMLTILVLLASLQIVPGGYDTALAAGTPCVDQTSKSGTYIARTCLTAPADGVTLSGVVTANVSVTAISGTLPSIRNVRFYVTRSSSTSHSSFTTDYLQPFTAQIPTARFADATYKVEANVTFADGFTTSLYATTINGFANGVSSAPHSNGSWAPASSGGSSLTIAAVGDGAGGLPGAAAVGNLVNGMNPDQFLYLGDVYNSGTYGEFFNYYEPTLDAIKSRTNPVPGNHESGNSFVGYMDYWDSNRHYYSYNSGGWHFIALDSTSQYGQTAAGTAQYNWLAQDLAANAATPCTMVYYHHPRFGLDSAGGTSSMQDIWALMAQQGVDVVLSGHAHNYSRWTPMDGTGQPSANGMVQFIAGTGGHDLQGFGRTDSRAASRISGTLGALKLSLNASGGSSQFVGTNGAVLDSSTFSCHDGEGTPGDTPTPTATPATTPTPTPTLTPATTPVPGATLAFEPVADALVQASLPDANSGTSSSLRSDLSPNEMSYLRFDVQGASQPITSATLRLYVRDGTVNAPGVAASADVTWPETGITWNNRPATGPPVSSAGAASAGTFVDFDVSSLVTANGLVTLALVPDSSDALSVNSRQNASNRPQLLIGQGGGSIPTPTPVGTASVTPTPTPVGTASVTPTPTVTPTATPPPSETPTTSVSFTPDADARVEEINPLVNFGGSSLLRADAGTDPDIDIYLRFTVTGQSAPPAGATLRMFVPNGTHTGSVNGPALTTTAATDWSEAGITWANKPPRNSTVLGDLGQVVAGTWVEFDVSSVVTGNGSYGFALTTTSADATDFASRETTTPPQLVLIPPAGGATATPSPTVTSTPSPAPSPTATPTPSPAPSPTATPSSINPAGTENPSLAGAQQPIVSSSDSPSTGISARAYDNDLNSTWYIGGSPSSATLTLDLGATYDVSGVKWKLYSLGYMDQFTVSARNVQGQSRTLGTFGNAPKTQVFYGVGVSDAVYARYVDIRVTNVNSDFYLGSVSEIEVWSRGFIAASDEGTNPAGTENPTLAGSKAPIVSSSDSPSTGISSRSYDNDLNSTWYLGGFPTNATLTLDLGATYDVSGVKWKFYSLGYMDQFTVSARNVEGQSRTLGTFGNGTRTQTFYGVGVADAVYARYVDFRVTNVNGDEFLGSVSEIEVWSRGFIAASNEVSSTSAFDTVEPTVSPTEEPTATPSPTEEPTATPTQALPATPAALPTDESTAPSTPTEEPTTTPAVTVTATPSPTEDVPATPAALPTEEPTVTPSPTQEPTATPSPTTPPTDEPTPAALPTEEPTATPSPEPTATPTEEPTATPSPEDPTATVALEAVTTGVVAGTGGQNVRCRAEPSTDGAIIAELAEGVTVPVTGPEANGWIPVTCGDGQAGYISAQFLAVDGQAPQTGSDPTATVPDETATAESGAGESPAAVPTEDVPTAVTTGEPTAVPTETPYPVVRVVDSEQSETGFRAIDQDPETIWSVYPSVSPDEVWLLLDLGQVRPIDRVTYELGRWNTLPVFELWLSEDGETWWNVSTVNGWNLAPDVEYNEALGFDARFAMIVVPDVEASGLGEIGGFREIGVWPGEATQSLSVLGNPTTPEPLPAELPTEAVIEDSPVVSAEATEITAPPPDEPAAEAAAPADAPVEPDPGATDAIEEPTAEPLNET